MYHTPKSVVSALAVTLLVWPVPPHSAHTFLTKLCARRISSANGTTKELLSSWKATSAVYPCRNPACTFPKSNSSPLMLKPSTSLVSIQSATVHNRLPRSTVIVVMFFACECASFSPTRTPRPLMPKPRRKRIQSFGRMSGLIPMVGRVFRFNFGKGTGSSNPWSFPAYQSSAATRSATRTLASTLFCTTTGTRLPRTTPKW